MTEATQHGLQMLWLIGVFYFIYLSTKNLFQYFFDKQANNWSQSNSILGKPSLAAYEFPEVVVKTFEREHPGYSSAQRDLAFRGLREYFSLHAHTPGMQLGMPSVLVDQAWHSFIICTREYAEFCQQYFGKMIHHFPDPEIKPQEMGANSIFKNDIVNTWRALEAYRIRFGDDATLRGPALLFSADSTANIQGWHWPSGALKRLAETEKESRRSSVRESSAGATAVFSSGDASASHTSSSCNSSSSSCGGDSGSSCGSGCGGGGGCGGA